MNTMSRIVFVSALVMVGALLATSQNLGLGISADIPFAFEVRDQLMPAGEYQFNRVAERPYIVEIRNTQTRKIMFSSGHQYVEPRNNRKEPARLEFRRYGNGNNARYFLAEVWDSGNGTRIHRSRAERELVFSTLDYEVAKNRPEKVVIYAKH